MDKIVCIIEPQCALVYIRQSRKWLFQGEHSLEDLSVVLRNVRSWKNTLHIFDLSSTTYFKWEKGPENLTWFEKLQWLREKIKQFRYEGDYSVYTINVRKFWVWCLKASQPILPQWIEEKLSSQSGAVFYHSYALEVVRTIKSYFPTADEKFQCFILERSDNSSIFAVYCGTVLRFLRLLFPMQQEPLTRLIQETIRYVTESFQIQDIEYICFAEKEDTYTAEFSSVIPHVQCFYGKSLERWISQNNLPLVDHGQCTLDRILLSTDGCYRPFRGRRFFLKTLETKLRKWAWIHVVILFGFLCFHGIQWYKIACLKDRYAQIQIQWKQLPWNYLSFSRIYPQLRSNYDQYLRVIEHKNCLESVLSHTSVLEKLEWTLSKGRYWFEQYQSEGILKKNLIVSVWRQYMPEKEMLEWKPLKVQMDVLNESDQGYFEGSSPFSRNL